MASLFLQTLFVFVLLLALLFLAEVPLPFALRRVWDPCIIFRFLFSCVVNFSAISCSFTGVSVRIAVFRFLPRLLVFLGPALGKGLKSSTDTFDKFASSFVANWGVDWMMIDELGVDWMLGVKRMFDKVDVVWMLDELSGSES